MVSWPIYLVLFLFGAAVGSFLNVVTLRYDPEKKLFQGVGGRSHCVSCGKILRWFELVPLFSFLIQLGRCRNCRAKLSWQYPIVEFLSGLIFVIVPYALVPIGVNAVDYLNIAIWIILFSALLILSVVDFRLYIIPDGLNIVIFGLAVINFINIYVGGKFGLMGDSLHHSLLGGSRGGVVGTSLGVESAFLFFIGNNIWLNYLLGGIVAGGFFLSVYLVSKGRAMGFGDVKLALVSGFLLGLPDMILATMLSFIVGAGVGGALMLMRKKGMKSYVPFGPFIAIGITLVFFFGYDIVDAYFRFFSFLG